MGPPMCWIRRLFQLVHTAPAPANPGPAWHVAHMLHHGCWIPHAGWGAPVWPHASTACNAGPREGMDAADLSEQGWLLHAGPTPGAG